MKFLWVLAPASASRQSPPSPSRFILLFSPVSINSFPPPRPVPTLPILITAMTFFHSSKKPADHPSACCYPLAIIACQPKSRPEELRSRQAASQCQARIRPTIVIEFTLGFQCHQMPFKSAIPHRACPSELASFLQ